MLRYGIVACFFALILSVAGCRSHSPASRRLRIAVIPQGSTHEYWKSVHAGAVKAANELAAEGMKIDLVWKGPLREGDREQQIQVVEGFISQGVDGIVLAPFDSHALVRPVEEARRAGIPTVVIDSDLNDPETVSFISTDNKKGGALAADRIARLLDGKGKVLVLRYEEGSASTEAREEGFIERLKQTSRAIEIVSSNQYAGATRESAKRTSENLLTRYGADIQAVFTPNESSTAGMLLALEDLDKAGKIRFIGFDASDAFLVAMRKLELHGVVVQDPFRMGELGVRTLVDHLRGKQVPKRVDTGAMMITPENMDLPESSRLLHPPLAKYLGGS